MPTWTGTVSTDWNTAGNWVTPAAVPTSATDAIFTGTPIRNCTTGTAFRSCLALNTTGYLGTLEVGSSAAGYIRVFGNITLGSTVGHIIGLSYIGTEGATCTLDVAAGFTVPYLAFGTAVGGPNCTITLIRSFVVTTLFRAGIGGTNATITAPSAMSIDVTNGSVSAIAASVGIVLNANVTLKLFGTTTYGNLISINGNVNSQTGSTISLVGILTHLGGILNLSAGTVIPGTSVLGYGANFSLNMGSNELYSFGYVSNVTMPMTLLSDINVQSCWWSSGSAAAVISGAFNIIIKGSLSNVSNTFAGGKFILTGAGTSADALATFSGTTMTITSFTLGSFYGGSIIGRIAVGQTITGPGIPANTVVVAQLTGTANQVGTYQVSNSITLGSTAIKGISCAILGNASLTSATVEINALANAFTFIGQLTAGNTLFNYLATNSGAFYAALSTLSYVGGGVSINMNSSTNELGTISNTSGSNRTLTLLSDVYCSTFGVTSNSDIINGVGYFICASGSTGAMSFISGTAGLKFVGGSNATWNQAAATTNAMAKIEFAKTGGATVSIPNSFTYASGTIKWTSGAVSHAGTLTLGATVTMDTTSVVAWNNITTTAGITTTISSLLSITGTLLLSGTTTFIGAYGFTCGNLACSVAASIITFQNINANPLAEYKVNGVLTLIGTLASRITLQAAGSSTFSGTITPVGKLNYISGVIPVIGMTVSQTTGISPVGLIGLLPSRPVITAGVSPTFTIVPAATTVIGTTFSMRAGYKAKFTLTNGTGTQNVAYVTTQDIDSNSGQTITSFGSNGDDTAVNTALFRTLNWGPLIAPSGSVYYTFVN